MPPLRFDLLLRHVDRSLDSAFGGAWQSIKWKLKYRLRRVPDFDTLVARRDRIFLRDVILQQQPRSLLEVGCGRGANLLLLWKADPSLQLEGFDLSAKAIESGRSALGAAGATQIRLVEGELSRLSKVTASSIDVVFAESVLMYVPPNAIHSALHEMLRVARRAIVLTAWHDVETRSRYDDGAWIYDFQRIVGEFSDAAATVLSYPSGTWRDARWAKYGAVIVVRKMEHRDPI